MTSMHIIFVGCRLASKVFKTAAYQRGMGDDTV